MKIKDILLLGLVAAFSSCSTAYRTGQTPDDVYYSPAQSQGTYVSNESEQDRNSYGYRNEEQEIRRGIQDRRYRSNVTLDLGFGYNPYDPYAFNPYAFNYNPYAYNPYGYKGIYDPYGYNPYAYNPYIYDPYAYNPYGYNSYGSYYGSYYPPVYIYPGIGNVNTNTGPRKVNLDAYNNTNSNNRINSNSVPARTFKTPTETERTGVGNVIRRVFTPSNNTYYTPTSRSGNNRTYSNDRSSTNTTPERTFNTTPSRTFDNPSSSSSSSSSSNSNSGSSNSSSAPVRTFNR